MNDFLPQWILTELVEGATNYDSNLQSICKLLNSDIHTLIFVKRIEQIQ